MVTKKIVSLQHPLVKHWVQLRSHRPYREEKKQLLLMGEKTIRELAEKFVIKSLITLTPNPEIPASEQYIVSEAILKKITGLEAPDGFAAEVALPEPRDVSTKQSILILDQISDPGNLGTLLRTALALGWDGVIFTPGTVDPFNDKALRASKGAIFHLHYSHLTPEEITAWFKEKRIHAYAADLEGQSLKGSSFKFPIALILSHEALGPATWALETATKITIPMASSVESLNVAASGAILLYQMRPLS